MTPAWRASLQICHEFERFITYMKNVRVGNFFGGLPVKQHRDMLKDKDKCPHIIVGTPGRIKQVGAGSPGIRARELGAARAPCGAAWESTLPCILRVHWASPAPANQRLPVPPRVRQPAPRPS